MTPTPVVLGPGDVPAVQELFLDDGGYCLRVHGHPPRPDQAERLFAALPPGKTAADKYVLGLREHDVLIAVLDLVRGYPKPEVAYVGLLQVAVRARGQGMGRCLHEHAVALATAWPEVERLRLSVVDANLSHASRFWEGLGYTPTGEQRPWHRGDGGTAWMSQWERTLLTAAP